MLDLELRRLEFRSGRIRLRWWFTRTHLLWNGLPCHCPLPWQATRLRYSATCIQAAQHVFRHSRDCLPMGRLVWLQRWFRTWCQVSTRLNSCARGNPKLIVQTRSFFQSPSCHGHSRHQSVGERGRSDLDDHGLETRTQVVSHWFLQRCNLR
jgi:hypothetical protein